MDLASTWAALQTAIARSFLLGPRGFPEREELPTRWLRLSGAHLFAEYELSFELEATGPSAGSGATRVRAVTRAMFRPGVGRLYKVIVIGSGVHAWIVRRFLRGLSNRSRPTRAALPS